MIPSSTDWASSVAYDHGLRSLRCGDGPLFMKERHGTAWYAAVLVKLLVKVPVKVGRQGAGVARFTRWPEQQLAEDLGCGLVAVGTRRAPVSVGVDVLRDPGSDTSVAARTGALAGEPCPSRSAR
jgi:hypothetical protein